MGLKRSLSVTGRFPDGAINVKQFGAKGDGVTDDTQAFKGAIAAGNGIYVPPGVYPVSEAIDVRGKSIQGAGHLRTTIRQKTASAAILIAGFGGCYVGDLRLEHASLPSTEVVPNGVGIRIEQIGDRSVIERLYISNVTSGIYCYEPVTLANNYIYSTAIRDIRFARFTHSAMYLKAFGAGNTGCVFSNLYAVNWDNFEASTKLSADYGFYFDLFAEFSATQLNVEHGLYNLGIVVNNARTFQIASVHFEGCVPNGLSPSFFYVAGDKAGSGQINAVSISFCTFDTANSGQAQFLRLGSRARVFVNGLVTTDNTLGPGTVRRKLLGNGDIVEGAGAYFLQVSDIDNTWSGGDFFPITPQKVPFLRQLNDTVYYWEEAGKVRVPGTAIPTVGTWAQGDQVSNTNPAAGGNIGWVCTLAGTPGTWKTFGTIAP